MPTDDWVFCLLLGLLNAAPQTIYVGSKICLFLRNLVVLSNVSGKNTYIKIFY